MVAQANDTWVEKLDAVNRQYFSLSAYLGHNDKILDH